MNCVISYRGLDIWGDFGNVTITRSIYMLMGNYSSNIMNYMSWRKSSGPFSEGEWRLIHI